MTSGRSGLPKFRQSVMPMGSAPVTTRFRHTSAIALAPPVNASSSHVRPLQSTAKARNFSVAPHGTRTTPASEPGRTTVLPRTIWSYWRQIHAREPTLGEPISSRSSFPRSCGTGTAAGSIAPFLPGFAGARGRS